MTNEKNSFEPMDEEKYWQIIDQSLKEGPYQSYQEQYLIHKLRKLSIVEIVKFELRTDELMHNSRTNQLWCAASLLNDGCSDDAFDYFRYWLISRGNKVYHDALKNPDSLIEEIIPNKQYYRFETFGYMAYKVFTEKTGGNLCDYIQDDRKHNKRTNIVFTWSYEEPETMRAICPNLFYELWRR
ncbi:DUF4240 domain-containing protein [Puia dinghuensis]|nr:DUF4240 domain-containing protein [Puia dinghuensis]